MQPLLLHMHAINMDNNNDFNWDQAFQEFDEQFEEGSVFDTSEQKMKDALIFLVDCNNDMFIPIPKTSSKIIENNIFYQNNHQNTQSESPFQITLRFFLQTIKEKIISHVHDLISIIFYSTRVCKNPQEFSNLYVLYDLEEPSISMITNIQKYYDDIHDFQNNIGSCSHSSALHESLWSCMKTFSQHQHHLRNYEKRILLFTNNDEPHHISSNYLDIIQQKIHDLDNFDISLILCPYNKPLSILSSSLPSPISLFDSSKFYDHYIQVDKEFLYNPDIFIQKKKYYQKRALASCPFILFNDIIISIKIYLLFHKSVKGSSVFLDADTNKVLKSKTQYLCSETGNILNEWDIRYFYEYSHQPVYISKNEINKLKHYDKPGLVLFGFKPLHRLKAYHNLKHSYFIYPDEKIIGSIRLFVCLSRNLFL